MVSAAVAPWILRYYWCVFFLLLMAPWIDERFRFADVHMDLERDIADFLCTEASILYSQGSSTIPCVISVFAKRGDIVADRGISFAIQKGLQILRSTVRWFEHNDLRSLEDVLLSVKRERCKRPGSLTRRFIVTEGILEKDGRWSIYQNS